MWSDIAEFVIDQPYNTSDRHDLHYNFVGHAHRNRIHKLRAIGGSYVLFNLPLKLLVGKLTMKQAQAVASIHTVYIPSRTKHNGVPACFDDHVCIRCETYMSILEVVDVKANKTATVKAWLNNMDPDRCDCGTSHLRPFSDLP